jgi:hypothetical protein
MKCNCLTKVNSSPEMLATNTEVQFERGAIVSNKVIQKVTEGWGQPAGAQRFHYFRESRSLCMVWFFTGSLQADDGIIGSCDCRKCLRAMKKTQPAR